MTAQASYAPVNAPPSQRAAQLVAVARLIRARARLISGLVLLVFVLTHFLAHIVLVVSVPAAEKVLLSLMAFWHTETGTWTLALALAVHGLNALWSIYIRRYLRMPAWEAAQLVLGLAIPPLIALHIIGTKVADRYLGTASDYETVLLAHWLGPWWYVPMQIAALLALWLHASIGVHFWLRTKRWYRHWAPVFAILGVVIPALALAGYVSGGNQILRAAADDPDFVRTVRENYGATPQTVADAILIRWWVLGVYAFLVVLPFAGRGVRGFIQRLHRPPRLTHAGGAAMPILPGATVLETLRAYGIPHASVCGGRGRCTTCRVRVTAGLSSLPPAAGLEAAALTRIKAGPGVRLACQIRPTADIAVTPQLPADASAAEGLVHGGMEGSERQVTVVFIDLRGSTTLGEAKLPYDVLFVLNQFFNEMTRALVATGGHYSNFTGDGLMALYGLDADQPALGAEQALRGAREMLMRLDQLNARLKADLKEPLRIGIGIHFGEAIVGALGPPGSQIVTAIGDTVNTTARLESLTKEYDCPLIVSEAVLRAAGISLPGVERHQAPVKGRMEPVAFYAFKELPAAVA